MWLLLHSIYLNIFGLCWKITFYNYITQNINNFWKMLFFTDFFQINFMHQTCGDQTAAETYMQAYTNTNIAAWRKHIDGPSLPNPWHCSKCCCVYNSFKIMNMKWVKSTRITLHLMSSYTQQAEQMLPPVPGICCSVFSMSSLFSADFNSSFSRWSFPPILSANTRGRTASFTDA